MALVESKKIGLGLFLENLPLKTVEGEKVFLSDQRGQKGTVVIFTCNHCPYAQAIWDRMVSLENKVKKQGISFIAINPNIHPDYPDDSPGKMKLLMEERGVSFPYYVDEEQTVAKYFLAECTPDIYLFDGDDLLYYHGRFDDGRLEDEEVSSEDLNKAIDTLLKGQGAPSIQHPSIGCSIKWKEN